MAKSFPKIRVKSDTSKMNPTQICKEVDGLKISGDPDCTNYPVDWNTIQQQSAALRAVTLQRQTDKDPALTLHESELSSKLKRSFEWDASYALHIPR